MHFKLIITLLLAVCLGVEIARGRRSGLWAFLLTFTCTMGAVSLWGAL